MMPARASLAWLVGLAVAPLCHAQVAGSVGAASDTVPAAILDAPTQAGAGPAASGSTLTQTTLLGIDREWLPAAHDIPIPDHVRDPDNLMRFYIDNRAQWRASDSVYLFSSIKASALEGYGYGNVSLESRSARLDLRELYARTRVVPGSFIDVGRINVNNGVGVSYNPTDFFREHATVDTFTHDYASWTDDRLGSFMVRWEKVFESGTLSAIYSPKLAEPGAIRQFTTGAGLQLDRTNFSNRFMIKANHDFGADFSPEVLVYHEDNRWKFGLNLTKGINEASTFFFEWAGGNSPSFSSEAFQYGISTGAFGPDTPALGGYGGASFQNQLSTGFNYTTLSKLNIILSYNYNQAGLSRAEWNRWFAMGKPGAPSASLASSEFWYMRTYGSEMRQLEDRQTAFLRIEQDDLVLRHLTFATFVVADLETHSYLLNASLDYRISDRWRVQFQAERKFGKKLSEFGSDSTSGEYLLSLKCYL
ncbi:hypothetical protein [Burkholderia gladioli]|uniref:hypothetical protein n=2 Tax=Burkholderia gladioli TaxID=28095 RepID=UPI00163DF2DF|nr:hypothetical protein [Burkholderia gladioli]